jgi:hypothetical protein
MDHVLVLQKGGSLGALPVEFKYVTTKGQT